MLYVYPIRVYQVIISLVPVLVLLPNLFDHTLRGASEDPTSHIPIFRWT